MCIHSGVQFSLLIFFHKVRRAAIISQRQFLWHLLLQQYLFSNVFSLKKKKKNFSNCCTDATKAEPIQPQVFSAFSSLLWQENRIKDQNRRVKISREPFLITVVLLIYMPPLPTLMPSPPSSAPPLLTLAFSVVECSLIDSNWVKWWGGSCFPLCPISLFTSAVSSLIWHFSSVCWTATCVLNTTDWRWEIVCVRV